MTHSNHRQGTCADLGDDFIVLAFPGRHFADLEARQARFREIGKRHAPVNVPGVNTLHHLVYDTGDKVVAALRDLAAADLGLSVTVTGLLDRTRESILAAGLKPHTVNQSLGIWGKTEKLPQFTTLEITTMCGHSRIAPELVRQMAGQIRDHAIDARAASRKLGKLCLCNIFNELRAAHLMAKLAGEMKEGQASPPGVSCGRDVSSKHDFGVVIDQGLCSKCLDCIPCCPVSAIIESPAGEITIDPEMCYECGVCLQPGVCPTGAIVARDLAWPRSLRGRFQNLHAPYRASPVLAEVSRPLDTTGEGLPFSSYQIPGELTNDVTGYCRRGHIGIAVELGRPHRGTTFRDVQTVCRALTPHGLVFPRNDPMSELAIDAGGSLRPDILEEKAGWVVLRLNVTEGQAASVIRSMRQAASEIDTVMLVNLISPVAADGSLPGDIIAREAGITPAPNGKTNVGLGRPLATL